MKNSKMCPKCHSNNIVKFEGCIGRPGEQIQTGFFTTSAVPMSRYICCSCGFIEEWVDKENLEKIINSKNAKR